MTAPRYQAFLALALRGDTESLPALISQPNWSWPALFAAATADGTLPALHSHLPSSLLPPEIADFLAAVQSVNAERNAALVDELHHAIALLNQAGIEPVLLKGAAYLTAGIFPNPATRYLCDIDLLVPESQLPAAVEALTSHGYRSDLSADPFGRFRHHHPPLSRPGRAPIELHHALSLGKSSRILPAQDVLAHSQPANIPGISARIPSPRHLATHLILHSQLHHSYDHRIWPSLREMSDLLALHAHYGPALNWPFIERRFRHAGEYGTLVLHLMQLASTFGCSFIPLNPTPLTRLRWTRRRILHRAPVLRFLDPLYMFRSILQRRLLMLRNLLSTRAGWKHFSTQILAPHIYQRLFTDVVEGRGR